MYAEPGKGAIHGAKDLRHGDVYLRLGLRVTNFGRTLKRCKSNPTSGCKFVWQQAEFVSSCLGQEVPDIEVEFAVDCAAFDYLPTCRFLSSERMLLKMEGSYLCFERVDHTE